MFPTDYAVAPTELARMAEERLESAGGDRTVFWVTPAEAGDVERELDAFADLAESYG